MMKSSPVLPALVLLLGGCLSPSPAPPRRYFDAVVTPAPLEAAVRERCGLRRVNASLHLRQPAMAWRLSPMELAFDEDNLWVAEPSELLRQALEANGIGANPRRDIATLDVQLISFEGALMDPPARPRRPAGERGRRGGRLEAHRARGHAAAQGTRGAGPGHGRSPLGGPGRSVLVADGVNRLPLIRPASSHSRPSRAGRAVPRASGAGTRRRTGPCTSTRSPRDPCACGRPARR